MIRLAAILLLLGSGACVRGVDLEVPKSPDMSAVVDAFEHPSANFGDDTAKLVAEGAFAALGLGEALGASCEEGEGRCGGPAFLLEALGGLSAAGEADQDDALEATPGMETRTFELNVGGVEVAAEGFAEITRICPGAGGSPDEANGLVELTSTFSAEGIDPVIWGEALGCLVGGEDFEQRIDAALRIFVGDNFSFDGVGDGLGGSPVVFDLEGFRAVGGEVAQSLDLSFRVGADRLELIVPQGDEHLVLVRQGAEIAFRAANGTFLCRDLGEGFATGACDDVAATLGEVRW